MEEDILYYSPTIMFRGTPFTSKTSGTGLKGTVRVISSDSSYAKMAIPDSLGLKIFLIKHESDINVYHFQNWLFTIVQLNHK